MILKGTTTYMDTTQTERFEKFWQAYPRKSGKKVAMKCWEKLAPDSETYSAILVSIESQKKSEQWQKQHGQFIPMPSTFLNQGRWMDEPYREEPRVHLNFRRPEVWKPKGSPRPHTCHPEVAKMCAVYASGKKPAMCVARSILAAANGYEALHVRCGTGEEIKPVCVKCGAVLEPWTNPLIKSLMEQYPKETVGWNPAHKGTLACDECCREEE